MHLQRPSGILPSPLAHGKGEMAFKPGCSIVGMVDCEIAAPVARNVDVALRSDGHVRLVWNGKPGRRPGAEVDWVLDRAELHPTLILELRLPALPTILGNGDHDVAAPRGSRLARELARSQKDRGGSRPRGCCHTRSCPGRSTAELSKFWGQCGSMNLLAMSEGDQRSRFSRPPFRRHVRNADINNCPCTQ